MAARRSTFTCGIPERGKSKGNVIAATFASNCQCYRSDLIQLSLTCRIFGLRLFQTFWRRWHFCPFCPFFGLAPMALLSGRPDYFLEFQKLCFYQ